MQDPAAVAFPGTTGRRRHKRRLALVGSAAAAAAAAAAALAVVVLGPAPVAAFVGPAATGIGGGRARGGAHAAAAQRRGMIGRQGGVRLHEEHRLARLVLVAAAAAPAASGDGQAGEEGSPSSPSSGKTGSDGKAAGGSKLVARTGRSSPPARAGRVIPFTRGAISRQKSAAPRCVLWHAMTD